MENASQCGAWLPLGRMRIATIGSRFCLGEGGGFVSRLVLLARLLAHGSSLAGASKRASRVSRKSDLGRARRLADELAAHEGLRGDLPEAVAVMGWTLRVGEKEEPPARKQAQIPAVGLEPSADEWNPAPAIVHTAFGEGARQSVVRKHVNRLRVKFAQTRLGARIETAHARDYRLAAADRTSYQGGRE